MRIPSGNLIRWLLDSSGDIENANIGDVLLNSDLLPKTDLGASAGSPTQRFAAGHFGPDSLHLNTTPAETGFATDWKLAVRTPLGAGRGNFCLSESGDIIDVTPAGDVGIGVLVPAAKLEVAGNIIADDPTEPNHVLTLGFSTTILANIAWQEAVISLSLTDPPGAPTTGDRYIVGGEQDTPVATGAWAGEEEKVAEWNGSTWDFFTPSEGWATWVEDTDVQHVYNGPFSGASWVKLGSTITHANLLGNSADDHPHYYLADGSRDLSGSLIPSGDNIGINIGRTDRRITDIFLGPTSFHIEAAASETGVAKQYEWNIDTAVGATRGFLRLQENIAANELFTIDPTGQIGINKPEPGQALDVTGSIEFSGAVIQNGITRILGGGAFSAPVGNKDFPSFRFDSDLTSGMFGLGNGVAFSTGGTEAMRITSGQNLGIGITDPGAALEIGKNNGFGNAEMRLRNPTNANTWAMVGGQSDLSFVETGVATRMTLADGGAVTIPGNLGIGDDPGVLELAVQKTKVGDTARIRVTNLDNTSLSSHAELQAVVAGTSGGDPALLLRVLGGGSSWYAGIDNNDSDKFKIGADTTVGTNRVMEMLPTGEVGINRTTVANTSLVIQGLAGGNIQTWYNTSAVAVAVVGATGLFRTANGDAALPSHAFVNDINSGMFSVGDNIIGFSTDGTQRWSILSNGDLIATGTSRIRSAVGTAAFPGISFAGVPTAGMFFRATDTLAWSPAGVEVMSLTPTLLTVPGLSIGAGITVGGNFLPDTDIAYDIGENTTPLRFRGLFLGPASLHISSTVAETGTARDWQFAIEEAAGSNQGNLEIREGASQYMAISTAGDIGVGKDPFASIKFSVEGDVDTTEGYRIGSSFVLSPATATNMRLGTGVGTQFLTFRSGGDEKMRLTTAGLLGVGTTAPTHSLTFPSTSSGIAVYNTADQTTNFERGVLQWSSDILTLRAASSGTGTDRQVDILHGDGTGLRINGSSNLKILGASPTIFTDPNIPLILQGRLQTTTGTNLTLSNASGSPYGATSGSQTAVEILADINQSSTAGYTALDINITETSVGSGANNLITAGVGGTKTFVVDNAGKVGVGTDTPLAQIHSVVTGPNEASIRLERDGVRAWDVIHNSGHFNLFDVTAGAKRFIVDTSGRTAIGADAPTAGSGLEVQNGPIYATDGSAAAPSHSFTNNPGNGMYTDTGVNALRFAQNSTLRWLISNISLAAAGTQVIHNTFGAEATPAYSYNGDENTGAWRPAAETLAWSLAGAEEMRLNAAGLGIGKTATQVLDITGPSNPTLRMESTSPTSNLPVIEGHSDRSGANQSLLQIVGLWDGTRVGSVRFISGPDTANKDDGQISFFTTLGGSETEKMRIDELGRVGIGTDEPDTRTHIQESEFVGGAASHAQTVLTVEKNDHARIEIITPTDKVGSLSFSDTASIPGRLDYDHATDRMSFWTSGATQMNISSAGNVGINNTATSTAFTGYGTYARFLRVGDDADTGSGTLLNAIDLMGHTSSNDNKFADFNFINSRFANVLSRISSYRGTTSTDGRLTFSNMTGGTVTERWEMGETGVLEGLTAGSVVHTPDGTIALPAYSFASDTNTGFRRSGAGVIRIVNSGTDRWIFQPGGNLDANGDLQGITTGIGTAASPTFRFRSSTTTGIFAAATGQLGFSSSGSEAMRINTTQDVLIGTSSVVDGALLTIAGTASVSTPTLDSHATTKAYVDALINGLDWQESVLDQDLLAPPGGESTGDRYIVAGQGGTATGDWAGEEEKIAEFNGATWDFFTPDEGFATLVEDEGLQYTYNGAHPAASWVLFGSVISHAALTGLGADDHVQYLLIDGTRGMTGNLNPDTDLGVDLGTDLLRWGALKLGPASLHLVSTDGETTSARDYSFDIITAGGATQGDFQITEAGTKRFTITAGGRVGIGDVDPLDQLHVSGGGILLDNNQAIRTIDTGSVARNILLLDNAGTLKIANNDGGNGGPIVFLNLSAAGESMRLTAAGKLGIGVTGPDELITIRGTTAKIQIEPTSASTNAGAIRFMDSADAGKGGIFYNETDDVLGIARTLGGTNGVNIDSAGQVGIGTLTPEASLHAAVTSTQSLLKLERTDGGQNLVIDLVTGWANYRTNGVHRWLNTSSATMAKLSVTGLQIGSDGTLLATHALTLPAASTGIALYNTADQTTDFERTVLKWDTDVFTILGDSGGTGTTRNLKIGSGVGSGDMSITFEPGIIRHQGALGGIHAIISPGSSVITRFQSNISTAANAGFQFRNAGVTSFTGSSGDQRLVELLLTTNQTSTAGYAAFNIDVTETSVGSGVKSLIKAGVGGTTFMRLDNTGKLGIGTGTAVVPNTLAVESTDNTIARFQSTNVGDFAFVSIFNQNAQQWQIGIWDDDDFIIRDRNDGAILQKIQNVTGQTAIGNSTLLTAQLNVTPNAADVIGQMTKAFTSQTADLHQWRSSGNAIRSAVTAEGLFLVPDGSPSAAGLAFLSDPDSGFYLPVDGSVAVTAGGVEYQRWPGTSGGVEFPATTQFGNYITSPFGGLGRYENQLLHSENFGNAVWIDSNTTVTTNTTEAPDGETQAETLAFLAGTSEVRQTFPSFSALTGRTFFVSVWLSSAGSEDVRLVIGRDSALFEFTKTITVGTTFERHFIGPVTFPSTADEDVSFAIDNGNDSGAHTVFAWGAQLVEDDEMNVYARTHNTRVNPAKGLVSNLPTTDRFGGALTVAVNRSTVGIEDSLIIAGDTTDGEGNAIGFATGTSLGNSAIGARIAAVRQEAGFKTDLVFYTNDTSLDERMRLDQFGNLGIGTDEPTHPFTLEATPAATGIALYNTADQTTNFERGVLSWSSDILTLRAESSGSGTDRELDLLHGDDTGLRMRTGSEALFLGSDGSGFSTLRAGGSISLLLAGGLADATTRPNVKITNLRQPGFNASSGVQTNVEIETELDQSGTAGYIALDINVTESSIGSGLKSLISAKVGGTTLLRLDNAGQLGIGTGVSNLNNTLTVKGATGTGITISGGTGNSKLVQNDSGRFEIQDGGGTPVFSLVNGTGNVGVGPNVPDVDFDVRKTNAGGDVHARVFNDDNTDTASHAILEAVSGGGAGGDPKLLLTINGGQSWYVGQDNNDADHFKIGAGTAVGVNAHIDIDTSGEIGINRAPVANRPLVVQALTGSPIQQWHDSGGTVVASLTGSGRIQAFDGSGAFPGHSFLSDGTTGIFSPGADRLGFSSGGSFRWEIDASGHLIPFADDTYDIGEDSTPKRVRSLFLGPASLHLVSTAAETTQARDWNMIIEEANGSTEGNFSIREASTKLMTVATNGQVGFSTDDPTHGLTLAVSQSAGLAFYVTADQTTNFERGVLGIDGGIITLQSEKGGSGSNRTVAIKTPLNTFQVSGGSAGRFDWIASGGVVSHLLPNTNNRFIHQGRTDDANQAAITLKNGGAPGMNASSGDQQIVSIEGDINQTSTAGYQALRIDVTETTVGSGTNFLIDAQVAGASKFSVDSTGDVIANAVTAPTITTTTEFLAPDGSQSVPGYGFSSETGTGLFLRGAGQLTVAVEGTEDWIFNATGLFQGIGSDNVISTASGNQSGPAYRFGASVGLGMFRAGADILAFSNAGSESYRTDASGNFLIGTSSVIATSLLTVAGTVSISTPTDAAHAATKAYVDGVITGLEWQDSVIDKDLLAPPGGESTGDRYIVAGAGGTSTGDWAGEEEKIAVFNGSGWDFITPSKGTAVYIDDEVSQYNYNDAHPAGTWVIFASITDHGVLAGLADDDHEIYLLVDGARGMTGNLNPDTDLGANLGEPALRWGALEVGPATLNIRSTSGETGVARVYSWQIETAGGDEQGHFRLLEGSTDLMTVTPGGLMGLGTISDPETTLHVGGTSRHLNFQAGVEPVAATGELTTVTGANLVDTETFTLIDADGTTVVFEFDSGGGITADVAVSFTGGDSADTVRDSIITAIAGATIDITATDGGAATVTLTQDGAGILGNTTIAETVANTGFVATSFTGGTNPQITSNTFGVVGNQLMSPNTSTVSAIVKGLTGQSVDLLRVTDSADAKHLVVDSGGNVGVNQSAPVSTFSIQTSALGTAGGFVMRDTDSTVDLFTLVESTTNQGQMQIYHAGVPGILLQGSATAHNNIRGRLNVGTNASAGPKLMVNANLADQPGLRVSSSLASSSQTTAFVDIDRANAVDGTPSKNEAALRIDDHTDNYPLWITDSAGADIMTIDPSGQVGIGTDAPGALLELSDGTDGTRFTIGANGSLNMGTTSASGSISINPNAGLGLGTSQVDFVSIGRAAADVAVTISGLLTTSTVGGGTGIHQDASSNIGIQTTAPTHSLTLPSTTTGIAIYNTADQTTNYERGVLSWASDRLTLRAESAGSGTDRALDLLHGDGTGLRIFGGALAQLVGSSSGFAGLSTQGGTRLNISARVSTETGSLIRIDNQTAATQFSAASGDQQVLELVADINQSSTAGYTGLLLNVTETSIGDGPNNLIDAKVGGTSRFEVNNEGAVTISPTTVATGLAIMETDGGNVAISLEANASRGLLSVRSGASVTTQFNGNPVSDSYVNLTTGGFGIGTNTPGGRLEVVQPNVQTSGTHFLFNASAGGSTNDATVMKISSGRGDGEPGVILFEIENSISTKLLVQADGNVGIGTASPGSLLDVRSSVNEGTETLATFGELAVVGRTEIGLTGGSGNVSIFSTGGAERIRLRTLTDGFIDTTANFGFGTTTPDEKLHVADAVDGVFTALVLENSTAADAGANETVDLSFGFGGVNDAAIVRAEKSGDFQTGGAEDASLAFHTRLDGTTAEKMVLSSTGNLTITGGLFVDVDAQITGELFTAVGTAASPSHSFLTRTTTGMFSGATNEIGWSLSGTERMTLTTAGLEVGNSSSSSNHSVQVFNSSGNITAVLDAGGGGGGFGRLLLLGGGGLGDPNVQFDPENGHFIFDDLIVGSSAVDGASKIHARAQQGTNVTAFTAENPRVADAGIDETIGNDFMFNGINAGTIRAGKDEDYQSGANESSNMQFLTRLNGATAEKMRLTSTGELGIGTNDPDGPLHVDASLPSRFQRDGNTAVFTAVAAITSANLDNTASTLHATAIAGGLSITAGSSLVNAGRIVFGKEIEWTGVAATRDSFMAFLTSRNAADTEGMRLSSAGNLTVGISDGLEHSVTVIGNSGELAAVLETVGGGFGQLALTDDGGDNNVLLNGEAGSFISGGLYVGGTTASADAALHAVDQLSGIVTPLILENTQADAGASTDEAVDLAFSFAGLNDVALMRAGKEADFTSAPNESAFLAWHTRLAGATAEKMRLTADGRLGIATASPNARLEVEDNGLAGSPPVLLKITADDLNPWGIVVGNDTFSTTDTTGLGMWFSDTGTAVVQHTTNGLLMLNPEGGFVGLGNFDGFPYAPDVQFHVMADGTEVAGQSASVIATFQKNLATGTSAAISIIAGNAANAGINFGDAQDFDIGRILYGHSDNSMRFITSNSEQMRVTSGGQVGIGLTNPLGVDAGSLHIFTGESGATTPGTGQDDLIIEGSGDTGITIQTPATNIGAVAFSDPGGAQPGRLQYSHSTERMSIRAGGADNHVFHLNGMVIKNSGTAIANPTARLHVVQTSASNTIATAGANTIASFQRDGSTNSNAALAIIAGNVADSIIKFGDAQDEDIGQISYDHNIDEMFFIVNTAEKMRLDDSTLTIGTGAALANFGLDLYGAAGEIAVTMGATADGTAFLKLLDDGPTELVSFDLENAINLISGQTVLTGDPADVVASGGHTLQVNAANVGLTALFVNDGNLATREGIKIQSGLDNPATGTNVFIRFADGDGGDAGGISRVTTGTAAFFAASDERLKEDIAPTQVDGLGILNGLQLFEFKKVKKSLDGKRNPDAPLTKIGFIAQQAQKVFPEMVNEDTDKVLKVADALLTPVVVKAIQELTKKLADALKRIGDLEEALAT